jgi:hypothetical protein
VALELSAAVILVNPVPASQVRFIILIYVFFEQKVLVTIFALVLGFGNLLNVRGIAMSAAIGHFETPFFKGPKNHSSSTKTPPIFIIGLN